MALEVPADGQKNVTADKPTHPLDPLTSAEVVKTSQLVKARFPGESLHFKAIEITEPPKKVVREYLTAERAGKRSLPKIERKSNALFFPRGTTEFYVAHVNLTANEIESIQQLDNGFYPQADIAEITEMRDVCLSHPKVLEAVRKFKLPEGTTIVCDTWPFGRDNGEERRRLVQCYMYYRDPERDVDAGNHYDWPLPFAPIFEFATKELVEMIYLPTGADGTVDPNKTYEHKKAKEFHQDLQDVSPRQDLKPLLVRQPQGPSFDVEGHLVTWQKWRFRVGFNWREGMVLHDVTYDGRELFHRLSLCEMFVPYGDPRNPYHRKSVFDVGDIGAGVAANNLQLGCDCLGVIKYFSFVISDSQGNSMEKPNAICMHEVDNGIGWKHTNSRYGLVSITRSRMLVLQTIITVGNYDYIFAWNLDQAAALHYEIKATGILSTAPIDPGVQVPWGTVVNKGVMAPYHQHVFNLRIDPNLDGPTNTLVEEDSHSMPISDINPYGVGYTATTTPVKKSGYSDFAANRVHKIINPQSINPSSGKPVAYALVSPIKSMLLADLSSWHARRARYAQHPYWVTKYADGELYAAGNYTYQSLPTEFTTTSGTSGDVASWAARGDSVDGEDIVAWHSISLTHNPRVEDYPVMPCDTMTVTLRPSGFFDANPALDVPQSNQGTNQSVLFEDVGAKGEGADACCAPGKSRL